MAEFVEQTLKMLCEWKTIEILEMKVKEDHIHVILSIPLKIIDIRSNGNAKRRILNYLEESLLENKKGDRRVIEDDIFSF